MREISFSEAKNIKTLAQKIPTLNLTKLQERLMLQRKETKPSLCPNLQHRPHAVRNILPISAFMAQQRVNSDNTTETLFLLCMRKEYPACHGRGAAASAERSATPVCPHLFSSTPSILSRHHPSITPLVRVHGRHPNLPSKFSQNLIDCAYFSDPLNFIGSALKLGFHSLPLFLVLSVRILRDCVGVRGMLVEVAPQKIHLQERARAVALFSDRWLGFSEFVIFRVLFGVKGVGG